MKVDIEVFEGKVIEKVTINNRDKHSETVTFNFTDGSVYEMCHTQDCCEEVWLEGFTGEPDELVGATILEAYKTTNRTTDNGAYLWSFYRINTNKGTLFFRWCGNSDSYYSVEVDINVVNDSTERRGFIFRGPRECFTFTLNEESNLFECKIFKQRHYVENNELWQTCQIFTHVAVKSNDDTDSTVHFSVNTGTKNIPKWASYYIVPIRFTYNEIMI